LQVSTDFTSTQAYEAADIVLVPLNHIFMTRNIRSTRDLLQWLPPKRKGQLVVGALAGESLWHYRGFAHPDVLKAFDVSMCGTRGVCDIFLGASYVPPPDAYHKLGLGTAAWARKDRTRPIAAWLQGNCGWTQNNRDGLISELMQHMRVDALGACLHNAEQDRDILQKWGFMDKMGKATGKSHHGDFQSDSGRVRQAIYGKYYFALVAENANCNDWVTERLYDALASGAIPVFFGTSQTLNDFLPCDHCVIRASDFDGLKSLADFLKALAANPDRFNEFLRWKKEPLPAKAYARWKHMSASGINAALGNRSLYSDDAKTMLCPWVEQE
jgi:hypothetical protein